MSMNQSASSPRRMPSALLVSAVALAVGLGPFAGSELARAESPANQENLVQLPSLAPLVKRVLPAVVNISVVEGTGDESGASDPDQTQMPGSPQGGPLNDFMRKFFEQQAPNGPEFPQQNLRRMAEGSGFIIDPSGLVVTNNHVVDDAKTVQVILQDGSKYAAKILGRDTKTDLALLKIEAHRDLPSVAWGDSGTAQIGDWVVAVGNPFGLGGTVSAGVISARGRDIHEGPYDDFLQVDAPINRGNSGGPLFNLKGEVVGINTAIYSPNGGSVGIGFAIPSSLAKPIVEQLHDHGKVTRGWLGVQIQAVTPAIASALGLPSGHGALVADVTKDSPADKAGVRQGDVLEAYNDHELANLRDLSLSVAETSVGSTANLKVSRKGQDLVLGVKIAEQPENMEMAMAGGESAGSSAVGVELEALTPELGRELNLGPDAKGAVVKSVADSSPLASVDLEPGDLIVEINGRNVSNPGDATALLNEGESASKHILLLIDRHGVREYVAWAPEANQG